MKLSLLFLLLLSSAFARAPGKYLDLLPYVQPAPDQGETNTCWFVASTGAMELLLNIKDKIRNPKVGGKNDLAESFLIWQRDYKVHTDHFIQEVVVRFNHGEAIHVSEWPFNAYNSDQTANMTVWNRHPNYVVLPRMSMPEIETELLFARGRKYATYVLTPDDIQTVKAALVKYKAPIIINYNDDGYWHVILIVGYDDSKNGDCYDVDASECDPEKGSFYVRDSNGLRYEARAYDWFLIKGNAAAVVKLKQHVDPEPKRFRIRLSRPN